MLTRSPAYKFRRADYAGHCADAFASLPQWLEIQPEDDEKTRVKKRKLAKSYKSKIRFQKMDAQQREKQSSWLNFQKGKGTKKKAGFFTGSRPQQVPC